MTSTTAPAEVRAEPVRTSSTARTWTALFAAVVAVCAIIVTAKVLTLDPGPAPRVIDQQSLTKQVTDAATSRSSGAVKDVDCPTSIVVKAGTKFSCHFTHGYNGGDVDVEIMDDMGRLSIDVQE